MLLRIAKTAILVKRSNYKKSFQRKQHLQTVDTVIKHSTVIMLMDIHKQAIENISVSKIQKQREAP